MQRIMCYAKIHHATVTEADLHYEGSLTVDTEILEAVNILPYERVQVVNVNNGERFETYIIPVKRSSGTICLNGAAARLGAVGDKIIIISYQTMEEKEAKNFKPRVVILDEKNKIRTNGK